MPISSIRTGAEWIVENVAVRLLGGDLTLGSCDKRLQLLDAGGSARNVALPTPEAGLTFTVWNVGTSGDIVLKNHAGTTITGLRPAYRCTVYSSASGWDVGAVRIDNQGNLVLAALLTLGAEGLLFQTHGASGPPTSGTYSAGQMVMDDDHTLWLCTAAGSPGSWRSESSRGGMFGAGTDGNLVFDGTSTVLGMVPVGGVYTLTRSIYPSSMTIQSGVGVVCRGYEIVCSGRARIDGTLQADGEAGGGGGATGSPGIGALGILGHDVGGSQAGTNGGEGRTTNGFASTAQMTFTSMVSGTSGAAGGAGGAGASGSGGSASPGGSVVYRPYRRYTGHIVAGMELLEAGSGGRGGGGGGGDGTNKGGGGGGGGSGGGVVHLCASVVEVGTSGVIRAKGGNGGNGGSPATGNCGGGGGGGGGTGGAVVLAFEHSEMGTPFNVSGGTGGAGGTGSGTGSNGSAGANGPNGVVILANLRTGTVTVT